MAICVAPWLSTCYKSALHLNPMDTKFMPYMYQITCIYVHIFGTSSLYESNMDFSAVQM